MKSPFKFLDAYTLEDREIFFGRDHEIVELYDRIFRDDLLLIYGASGTGKTSLLNCGLGNKFSDTDWFPLFIRRRDHIMKSLYRELNAHAHTPIPMDMPLHQALLSLFLDVYIPVYLIFDQLEELFILGNEDEQTEFFHSIASIVESDLLVKVIIVMREEYIADLSDFERIIPNRFENKFRVEKMRPSTIKEVITKTAQAYSISLVDEEEMMKMFIENIRDKRKGVDLTNLQVYLDRLYREDYQRQKTKGIKSFDEPCFDLELVEKVGKLEDVLAEFLDEQLIQIDRELGRSGVALDVLFAFVSDDATNQSTTAGAIKEYLFRTKNITEEDVDFCMEKFEARRIIRRLEEQI